MPTLSLRESVNGTHVDLPTFGYWVKVGMGLALGVMLTSGIASLIGFIMFFGMLMAPGRSLFH